MKSSVLKKMPNFDNINQIELDLKPTAENIDKIAAYVKDLITEEKPADIWISRNDDDEIRLEIYELQDEESELLATPSDTL